MIQINNSGDDCRVIPAVVCLNKVNYYPESYRILLTERKDTVIITSEISQKDSTETG